MRHLIKKQIIELSLDKRVNYYHVQQQVSDRFWNDIVPLMEKSFDAISSEDEVMEIDKFELDLGVVSEKMIGDESWMEEIRKKIEEKIIAITNPASPQYAVRISDRRLGVIGQWQYYMVHGFLPWNSGQMDDRWHQEVLEALAIDFESYQKFKEKILQDSSFLKRIVTQHQDSFLQKLTEITAAKKQELFTEYIDELLLLNRHLQKRKKITLTESDQELRNRLWQNILRWASGSNQDPGRLISALIRFFVGEKMVTAKIPPVIAEKLPRILPLVNRYSKELKIRIKKEKINIETVVQSLNISDKIEDAIGKREQFSEYNGKALYEEGIFIVNAGTVLLHPFLKTLFDRLKLIQGSDFINEHAKETCLYLIHYLGTGRVEAKEFELTLAKLLCGYPLEMPVGPAEELKTEYIIEADGLLEAAIAQWEILQNTSVSGLREGFLQRPGMLFSKNGDFYLRIEKSSIDVLLDYLPWNLGMIMLPWMKDILRVEWR